MTARSTTFRIIGFAAVVGLMVGLWKSGVMDSSVLHLLSRTSPHGNPVEVQPPTYVQPSLPPSSALGREQELSFEVLTSLVATRLREWEAEDEPEQREERTRELEQLFANGERKMEQRLKIIEGLPLNLIDFAFGLPSFQEWMFSHPTMSLEWIAEHRGISDARILTLFQRWAQKDPEELRHYLSGLAEGEWKQKALMAASYEALANDPVEAISRARQMNPGDPQTGLLEIATAAWARRDAVAATHWVSEVEDLVLREQLGGALAVGFADTAPKSTAEWLAVSFPPGRTLDRSVADVAGAWAKRDPAAAGEWVARLPAGEGRTMALGTILNTWANHDRIAAIDWIRKLPEETLRKQAEGFVDFLPSELGSP